MASHGQSTPATHKRRPDDATLLLVPLALLATELRFHSSQAFFQCCTDLRFSMGSGLSIQQRLPQFDAVWFTCTSNGVIEPGPVRFDA